MQSLTAFLEQTYPFQVTNLQAAPRGLVAETYIADTTEGRRFFIKIIHAPLFKAHLRHSAAAHQALAHVLGDRINQPVQTRSGAAVARLGDALVAVSCLIDAPAADAYDTFAFGQLIGRLHAIPVTTGIPCRVIGDFAHVALLDTLSAQAFAGVGPFFHIRALAAPLAPWRAQYLHYRARMRFFTDAYHARPPRPRVYTHGDAGGNVLAHSPTDLMIIDWDYIGRSEPERDLWVFEHDPAFIAGYRTVFPAYEPDEIRIQYAVYRQFFDYFTYILEMIARIPADVDASAATANLLSLFTDWCPPHMR